MSSPASVHGGLTIKRPAEASPASALCGATFVYACVLLGPVAAMRAVAAGTLGSIFIVVMFVQELEGM